MKVTATPVLTLTGIKQRYCLMDMAYGEWLIYRAGQPLYYINIFDEAYEGLRANIGDNAERYLQNKLRNSSEDLSLKQNVVGLEIGKTREVNITVEKLPLQLLK